MPFPTQYQQSEFLYHVPHYLDPCVTFPITDKAQQPRTQQAALTIARPSISSLVSVLHTPQLPESHVARAPPPPCFSNFAVPSPRKPCKALFKPPEPRLPLETPSQTPATEWGFIFAISHRISESTVPGLFEVYRFHLGAVSLLLKVGCRRCDGDK